MLNLAQFILVTALVSSVFCEDFFTWLDLNDVIYQHEEECLIRFKLFEVVGKNEAQLSIFNWMKHSVFKVFDTDFQTINNSLRNAKQTFIKFYDNYY